MNKVRRGESLSRWYAAAPAIVLAFTSSLVMAACASASQGVSGTPPAASPLPPPTGWSSGSSVLDGVFTSSQASRGEQTFREECVACHSTNEFMGPLFALKWIDRTAGDIFDVVSTLMPEVNPGSLRPEQYADVLAYFFSLNGYPSGEEALPADAAVLQNVRIEAAPAR